MAAPKGNKFWEARYNHGRKPKTKNPETLWKAAVEYFEWCEANPLITTQVIPFQGEGYDHPVAKPRVATIIGLCLYIGITQKTWSNWKEREGFLPVMEAIESIIYDWKYQGAANGLYNASIIARDLGLKDSSDVTSGGEPIGAVKVFFDKPSSE